MPRLTSKLRALPRGTISTPAAAARLGIPYRTLIRWVELGRLCPELVHGEAGEHSAAYAWRDHDLVMAAVCVRTKCNPKAVRQVYDYAGDWSGAYLVETELGFRVVRKVSLAPLIDDFRKVGMVLSLGKLLNDTKHAPPEEAPHA